MAKPVRNANPDGIQRPRTFFVTTKTSMGRSSLRVRAECDAVHRCAAFVFLAGKFQMHDFVVMPDHVHLLVTVGEDMAVEKAVQLSRVDSRIG